MKRFTYEFVKEKFEKEGYELLSKEYVNVCGKLRYKCPKVHEHYITWDNWQKGKRCSYCEGNARLTIEFVKLEFAKEDYILLTEEYMNAHQKLEYICPNGYIHSITWDKWQQGQRCSHCAGLIKKTIEFVRLGFEKEEYQLLTEEYVNCEQKLDYICPRGHKHNISWGEWAHNKNRCPYCVGKISKGEIEVRNFIKSLGIKVLANDRNQIFNPFTNYGLELDIFMPAFSKAIEYNGEYWHKNKDIGIRDLLKQQLCKSKGIDLLTIWDKEWLFNNNVCRNKIKKFVVGR